MTATTVRIARWWVAAALGVLLSAAFLVTAFWAVSPVPGGSTDDTVLHRSALVASGPARLSISPEPVPAGATMVVTGADHCPLYGQTHDGYFEVGLSLGAGLVAQAQGLHGGFTATLTAQDSPGSYVLTSTCLDDPGEKGASRGFTVTKPDVPAYTSSVVVKPDAVTAGDHVTVVASLVPVACTRGVMVLTWDSLEVTSSWTMFGGLPGGSTDFAVPSDTAGVIHPVGVTCTGSDGAVVDLPTADLRVTPIGGPSAQGV